MEFELVGKLVHKQRSGFKSIIGYMISLGGTYQCSVTVEKAKELGVKDIEIAHLFDLEELDVIPIANLITEKVTKYGVVNANKGFFEEFADSPRDYFGDRVIYYGYYFEPHFIVKLDDDFALNRMKAEKEGVVY